MKNIREELWSKIRLELRSQLGSELDLKLRSRLHSKLLIELRELELRLRPEINSMLNEKH